jgi:hypothetical protein
MSEPKTFLLGEVSGGASGDDVDEISEYVGKIAEVVLHSVSDCPAPTSMIADALLSAYASYASDHYGDAEVACTLRQAADALDAPDALAPVPQSAAPPKVG